MPAYAAALCSATLRTCGGEGEREKGERVFTYRKWPFPLPASIRGEGGGKKKAAIWLARTAMAVLAEEM